MSAERASLWFTGPHELAWRHEPLPPPAPDEVQVRTSASAISPGTELLIYRGQAPADLPADATLAALAGGLAFPLKYGYACVGQVTACGAAVPAHWLGRRVFAFNPHETHFNAQPDHLQIIPDDVDDDTALFLPNMETAVNFALDGQPHIGEVAAVLGLGVVGLLTLAVLAQFPLAGLVAVEPHPARRARALPWGASHALAGDEDLSRALPQGADVTFELSGNPAALDTAIALTGFGGRVVIGSWYGQKRAPLDLGGRFHRSRIQLISSQVSTLTPHLLARWSHARRLAVAWAQLRRVQPARLITHRFPWTQASTAYAQLHAPPAGMLQVVLTY